MPYKIDFLENKKGIITTFSGVVTDEELFDSAVERVLSGHDLNDFNYAISDFTEVTYFKISTDGIKANAEQAIDFSKYNKNFILVAVMPEDLEFGMARMWQAYADESSWTSNVVKGMNVAKQWIEEQLVIKGLK